MSARLTVVLDDEELYRKAKIRAVEDGVPLKALIEEALRRYVESTSQDVPMKEMDWDAYDRWQAEAIERDRELGGVGPTDLSDVKKYLYSGCNADGQRGPSPTQA